MRLTEEEYQKILQKRRSQEAASKKTEKPKHNFQKKHKYNAKKTERGPFKFDSQKEAKRYDQLLLLKESGEVLFFLRQAPFHLPGNVTYRVDFIVFWSDGRVGFEDVKGYDTPMSKIKRKIVESVYPVTIELK